MENTLNLAAVTAALANLSDDRTLCELSDWAINTLRAAFGQEGGTALLKEEAARIGADLTFEEYLHANRQGSHFRLTRNQRAAVFAALVTHRATRAF